MKKLSVTKIVMLLALAIAGYILFFKKKGCSCGSGGCSCGAGDSVAVPSVPTPTVEPAVVPSATEESFAGKIPMNNAYANFDGDKIPMNNAYANFEGSPKDLA